VSERIVVTGLGIVGAAGLGIEPFAELLRGGAPACLPIEPDGHLPEAVRLAARVPDVDVSPWISPRQARRMSRPSLLAVLGARLAVEDAALDVAPGHAAVCLATALGPTDYTERILATIFAEGPESVSPFHFSECVANAGAAQVGIDRDARGANLTITAREAGPALVLDSAARLMRAGRASLVYAICADELSAMTHAVLDRMQALTRQADAVPRPYAEGRDGALAAEGATAVVLERESVARARGARVRAALRATVATFDPTASARDWGHDPKGMAEGLRAGLRRADLEPTSIDLVVASAAGTVAGDAYEAALLRALFDAHVPPVVAPKAHLGEWGGGHLGAALLALEGRPIAAPRGRPDARLGIAPVAAGSKRPRRVLLSALAAGGAAGFAVLEAVS